MGLTAWAIDKSRVTLVTALVVAGAGYQSYVNMPRAEDPGFVIRVALVITRFPGASPERVEQLITDKLEKAVQEMPELDYITSNSKTGVSELMVNFKESYRDMRPIFDSLRRKIDSARGDLPDGVIGPFVNDEFGDVFGTIVTITGSDFEYAELKLIADEVRDGLLLVTDVAKVEIYGAQDERVFVEYNNARLSEIGLSPEQLRNILAARNIVSPGGNIASRRLVDEIMPRVERFGADHFPDLKITARPIPLGPPAWPPVAVRISGRNSEVLFDIVEQVKARLHEIPGTKLIDDDWGARSKKLVVQVDQPRALRAGVSSQDIAVSLQSFLSGIVTTEYREGDKIIPVTLRSVAAQRNNLDRLESLNVYSQSSGLSVPLKQVADVRLEWQPSTIRRRSRLRTVTVEAGTEPGVTAADINAQLQPWLDELQADWGPGYSFELGGEQENSGDANAAIGAKLPIAAMIIVLLLVGQFNSVRKPLIVLITIPLGLIGVVLGLLATQLYFGFMTLLGIISLSGIVINNAIVLIDRINIEIETNGLQPAAAIIESAQRRLRPIVMTTCTAIGGLLPLYLGGGPMWEPLAVAIMGGLIFATLLTLGVGLPRFPGHLWKPDNGLGGEAWGHDGGTVASSRLRQ